VKYSTPKAPDRLSQKERLVELALVLLAVGFSSFGLLRQLWAWPDATWQTTLFYLTDIDLILSGRPDQAVWFELGNGHAMTGYRIFTYFNASFFGLNASLELVVYWALVFSISVIFVIRVLRNAPSIGLGTTGSILILIVMNSLAGSGSRGMELGTFFGTFLMLCLSAIATSKLSNRSFLIASSLVVPVAQFLFLGGYMAGWVFGLLLVTALILYQSKRTKSEDPNLIRIMTLSLVSLFWMAVFYFLIPKTHSTVSLFDVWEKDLFFPIKYIIFGFANAVFTSQSFEGFSASESYPLYLSTGIIIFSFCLVAILGSLKRSDGVARLGQVMVLFGFGTSLMLLFTRAFGEGWLLSSWYSFHFKLTLCGAIILFATSRLKNVSVPSVLVFSLIAALVLTSSKLQFDRQTHERSYWLNIQRATYFSETIADRGDGYTQLIASLEQSLAAVQILRKHNLGVFRPGAVDVEELKSP
jgi:hypothetical protein